MKRWKNLNLVVTCDYIGVELMNAEKNERDIMFSLPT